MLSSAALLTFLHDGPLALAVINEDGLVTLVSQVFSTATGLAAGEPAPEWLTGPAVEDRHVQLGDRHYVVWVQAIRDGRMVVLRDCTEGARAEDRIWEKHTHLSRVYAALQVRDHRLLTLQDRTRAQESELRALEARSQEELRRAKLGGMLERHLPPEVARSIASSPTVDLGTHKSMLTVFFVDLPSFDQLISEMESEEIMEFLDEYHAAMREIVFRNGGTVDKSMSVRIKGFFGDPILHEDHAARSVRTTVQMRDRLREIRSKWFSASDAVDLVVGLNTGYATVGTVGKEPSADYTAVGKNVSLASALQQEAKPGQILMSSRTHEAVKGLFYVDTQQIVLRGSSRPLTVYQVKSERLTVEVSRGDVKVTQLYVPEAAQPTTMGPYTVIEKLGEGGMGIVYKGLDERLKRHVALKVLSAMLAADRKFIARFKREAQALASLNSPYIAQIYYISDEDGPPFFAMELVEGPTLGAIVAEQGPLPLRRTLKLLSQLARGLQTAVEGGVIHRDIKPDNILINPKGQAKLTDFGLVKTFGEDEGMTSHGMVLGTPLYMSPEQARGHAVDLRSDIYSLGATAYHMLAGGPPFTGDSALAIMRKHDEADLPALSTLPKSVSPAVYELICRMMAKRAEDRYQDYEALLEAIEGC